jgi:hypothetical protein
MDPIKPITVGGAPSALKNGASKEEVIENVKNTKNQLTIRVSRFPCMKENSFLMLFRRPRNSFNSILETPQNYENPGYMSFACILIKGIFIF